MINSHNRKSDAEHFVNIGEIIAIYGSFNWTSTQLNCTLITSLLRALLDYHVVNMCLWRVWIEMTNWSLIRYMSTIGAKASQNTGKPTIQSTVCSE